MTSLPPHTGSRYPLRITTCARHQLNLLSAHDSTLLMHELAALAHSCPLPSVGGAMRSFRAESFVVIYEVRPGDPLLTVLQILNADAPPVLATPGSAGHLRHA